MPEEPDERPAQRPSRNRRRGRPVTFQYPPESGQCDDEAALELLSEGSLKIEGRLVAASNATMYCTVRRRGLTALGQLKADLNGGALATTLAELLSPTEVTATRSRIELLIEHRVHPYPPENWPAVPWPPV